MDSQFPLAASHGGINNHSPLWGGGCQCGKSRGASVELIGLWPWKCLEAPVPQSLWGDVKDRKFFCHLMPCRKVVLTSHFRLRGREERHSMHIKSPTHHYAGSAYWLQILQLCAGAWGRQATSSRMEI